MHPGQSWKAQELAIAKVFGVTRNPNNGRIQSDVDIPGFSIESKKRKRLPAAIVKAMAQATRNCKPGRKPLAVLIDAPGPGVRVQRYALLTFEDFVELHQKAYGPATTPTMRDGVVDGHDTLDSATAD